MASPEPSFTSPQRLLSISCRSPASQIAAPFVWSTNVFPKPSDVTQHHIAQLGALLGPDESDMLLSECCVALAAYCTVSPLHCEQVADTGAGSQMLELLRHEVTPQVAFAVLFAMASLVKHEGVRKHLRQQGAVTDVLEVVAAGMPELRKHERGSSAVLQAVNQAMLVLTALAGDEVGRAAAKEAGAVPRLLELAELPQLPPQLGLALSYALAELCRSSGCCRELAQRGGVPLVLRMLQGAADSTTELHAAAVLARLALDPDMRAGIIVAGALPLLRQLLAQHGPHTEVVTLAVQTLAHLSSSHQGKLAVHASGCLAQLLGLLQAGADCAAVKWACHAVCNLTALQEACAEVAGQGQQALRTLAGLMLPLASPCAPSAALAVANMATHALFTGTAAAAAVAAAAAHLRNRECPQEMLGAALTCASQLVDFEEGRHELQRQHLALRRLLELAGGSSTRPAWAHLATSTLAKCATDTATAERLLQMGAARAVLPALVASAQVSQLHAQQPQQAAPLLDAALMLLANICAHTARLDALRGIGLLQQVMAVLLQHSPDSRPSSFARLALCSACQHGGCAAELLDHKFGSVLVNMPSPFCPYETRELALAPLHAIASCADRAVAERLCSSELVQPLLENAVAAADAQMAALQEAAEAAAEGGAPGANAGAEGEAPGARDGDIALQLCAVLADLAELPSCRMQLAKAARTLAQLVRQALALQPQPQAAQPPPQQPQQQPGGLLGEKEAAPGEEQEEGSESQVARDIDLQSSSLEQGLRGLRASLEELQTPRHAEADQWAAPGAGSPAENGEPAAGGGSSRRSSATGGGEAQEEDVLRDLTDGEAQSEEGEEQELVYVATHSQQSFRKRDSKAGQGQSQGQGQGQGGKPNGHEEGCQQQHGSRPGWRQLEEVLRLLLPGTCTALLAAAALGALLRSRRSLLPTRRHRGSPAAAVRAAAVARALERGPTVRGSLSSSSTV